jgi:hypothetical protein
MDYSADKHWNNVLALARKYAILATHKTQIEKYGVEGYNKIQKMNKGEK